MATLECPLNQIQLYTEHILSAGVGEERDGETELTKQPIL